MATKAKPRARKPRVKQGSLPGMAPPIIKAIEDAADNYYDAMQERLPLTKAEKEAKESLIEQCKEHKVDRYKTQTGRIVIMTGKSNVKVQPVKAAAESNGDGEEE